MIKNIDNVAAGRHREPTWIWTRALVGRLALLRSHTHELLRRLKQSGDADVVDDAVAFARTELGVTIAAHRDAAHACLGRPLRVCGMVPNTGEPGGGPFWVRDRNSAVTRQIVESAQVASDAAQQAVFRAATHFNPVYLACAFDDAEARRYELDRFVDPGAAFITGRSSGGRELIALERPGLWNGGMAHWNTVFVEVPLTVFNPVKTVLDLLRPAHQAE